MLLLCAPSYAAAQGPLVPGATAPPVVRQPVPERLNFGLFVSEGVDFVDMTEGRPGLLPDRRLNQNMMFSEFNGSFNYSKLGDQESFTAAGGGDLRYYRVEPMLAPSNFYGGVSFQRRVSRRVSLRGSGNLDYSPFYSFGSFLLPASTSDVRIPSNNQNIARLDTVTTGGSATLSWALSRRSSLNAGYTLDYITTPNTAYRVFTQGASAGYQRQITRYTSLRLGYGYRRSEQYVQSVPFFDDHIIDTGIGYRRPISSSRRTTVAFGTGLDLVSEGGLRSFRVIGNASLNYQLKRTWSTGVSYSRSVQKAGGLLTPFVSDTLSGDFRGLWTRRFGFTASGGFSLGESALVVRNSYDTVYGSGRLHYDLSRRVPIFVEYVYYQYSFSQTAALAPGFPVAARRNGIRFGLGYSTPLIGQRLDRQ